MEKISVYFSPEISEEERIIITEAFHQKVDFLKLGTKGIQGAAFDNQIVLDVVVGLISAGLYDLIKNLFNRNRKRIMDGNTRPKHTVLILRKSSKWISISNVNNDNKLRISVISANSIGSSKTENEYSDEKLSEYLRD